MPSTLVPHFRASLVLGACLLVAGRVGGLRAGRGCGAHLLGALAPARQRGSSC
jgi:hypothetical protein